MSQYIYGPLTEDNVVLFTRIADEWYYLKPDPNINYPPYFGKANTTAGYFPLLITLDGHLTNTNGNGFVQSSTFDCGVISSTSDGQFNYVWSATNGTPLVYGVNFSMNVNNELITFFYKNSEAEVFDNANFNVVGYEPSYTGIVRDYFLVPIHAYSEADCLRYTNGAFLAYSNTEGYAKTWYSTEKWCNTGYEFKPCMNGATCGECFGPCSSNVCTPVSEGNMECRKPNIENAWYNQIWFYFLIAIIIVIAIILVVYFTLINPKPKTLSKTTSPTNTT